MPEYHVLRFLLGLAELSLVYLVLKRRVGYLLWFAVFIYVSSAVNIAPAFPRDVWYTRFIQVPLFSLLLGLTFAATFDVFSVLLRQTFARERWLMLSLSGVCGAIPLVASASWKAENWYQGAMIALQYALLAETVGMLVAWRWISQKRPVRMEAQIDCHGWLWTAWLLTCALMASTTKGGLFWEIFTWKGGGGAWRAASDSILATQILLCGAFWLNLRRWRGGIRDD